MEGIAFRFDGVLRNLSHDWRVFTAPHDHVSDVFTVAGRLEGISLPPAQSSAQPGSRAFDFLACIQHRHLVHAKFHSSATELMSLKTIFSPLPGRCLRMLGNEIGTIHSRTELTELLKIHVQHGALDVETGREIAGAMNYKERTVRDVMTPAKDCFMLSVSEKLNFKVRA